MREELSRSQMRLMSAKGLGVPIAWILAQEGIEDERVVREYLRVWRQCLLA
jgi:molybdopterin/thiamine biosynthesis adenylyltransferase